MSSAAALYTETLLAHVREPRRRGLPEHPCAIAEASNRLCGDVVTIGLHVEAGRAGAFGFDADACAITVASASMLGDVLMSRPLADVAALADAFSDWLGSDDVDQPPPDIVRCAGFDAFIELKQRHSRRRCALLPFEALSMALGQCDAHNTDHDRA